MTAARSERNRRLNLIKSMVVLPVSLIVLAIPLGQASAQGYLQLGPFAVGVAPTPYYPRGYYYYYPDYIPPAYYYYYRY